MGEIATSAVAATTTHDLNAMFQANAERTWDRIASARTNINSNFAKPTANPANPTPKVRSLRFVAAELTRHVGWNEDDPSRGDRRKMLKWFTWVELDAGRRAEAKKIAEVVDYFASQPRGTVQVTWAWVEDMTGSFPNGSFAVDVLPADYASTTSPAVTVTVTSTDIFHTRLGGASEQD
jgi:hypothetical protein